MSHPALRFIDDQPRLSDATLLLALTGWMDGGLVSTGTVRHFMLGRDVAKAATIEPGGFYIDNFPGSMEISALFRPHVKIAGGLIDSFDMAVNEVFVDAPANMAFFLGKEPNLNWIGFADCIFDMAKKLNTRRMIFMGSFGGSVPHTREPRLFGSVSEPRLKPLLKKYALRPSDYEGPGSFATYLLAHAPRHDIEMLSIAAEIPGYLQGPNPLCIGTVTRRLAHLLDLQVDLAPLRSASTAWELQITELVEKDSDLTETVRKLEEQYDNELIESTEE